MDFHKVGQTMAWFVLCVDCHEGIPVSTSSFYLRYEVTITQNSSRGIARLTTGWKRCVCGLNERQLVTLFAHVEQSRSRSICVRVNRVASKDPKQVDRAAGTDFTRLRHGSRQLSLIEIPKCNASQAAAATETDPRQPRWISPETRRGWGGWSLFGRRNPLASGHERHFMRII